MKTIGYLRVSTVRQAAEGVSLDAQRSRIEDWCKLNGHELVAVYADEGISGKRTDNRPELQKALDHVCREGATLVSYSLSRVARSTADLLAMVERFREAGVGFVSLTENLDTTSATGRLIFTILAGFATFERELISERVKGGMEQAKKENRRLSKFVPMGYRLKQTGVNRHKKPMYVLEPDEQEQAAVAVAVKMHAEGRPMREIRRAVSGLPRTFSAKSIRNAVRRAS